MDDVTRNPPPLRSGTQRVRPLSTVTALAPGQAADPCQSNQNSNARTRQPPRELSTVTTDLGVGKQHVICLAVERFPTRHKNYALVSHVSEPLDRAKST